MAAALLQVALGVVLSLIDAAHAGELSDPTRPHGYQPATAPAAAVQPRVEWRLTMIKDAPGRRAAILNGELVTVGDRVRDAEVVAIGRSSLDIEIDGDRMTLELGAEPVKRDLPPDESVPIELSRLDDARPGAATKTESGRSLR